MKALDIMLLRHYISNDDDIGVVRPFISSGVCAMAKRDDDVRNSRGMYCVMDKVATQVYPFIQLFPTDGAAVRNMRDVVNSSGNAVSDSPSDYSLLCVGFMRDDGTIFGAEIPRVIVADVSELLNDRSN